MAAVTQAVPTFLGGVSKQADTKKQPGQVDEILNGYADPTYGLLKRNGTQFLGLINEGADDFTDGHWFSISRDNDERYIGVITKTGNIRIWNTVPTVTNGVLSLTEATVTNKTNADVVSYLTPPATTRGIDDFHTLSYLDQTYIVNKNKTIAMNAKSNYYLRTRATVVIGSIDYDSVYKVYINGTAYSFTTVDLAAADTRGYPVTSDEILTGLKTAIDAALGPTPGNDTFTVTRFANSLEIEIKDGQTPFTIEVEGGVQGVSLTCYQDDVVSSARLAAYTKPGRRVKITNAIDERASYYVKFSATGGTGTVSSGSGYWEEARGWDIDVDANGDPVQTGGKYVAQLASNGFNAETMPYKLVNTGTNTFAISKETWASRFTGNDYGNPVPSFVGKEIKFGLIYSNRLVFLTTDTIAMSVAKDFENFFFTSAQTVIASDPVDVETSSSRVSNLFAAVPQAQGLVLFSEYEQYLLYSESGIISPSDVIIRTISQYEADRIVAPKDTGDFIGFVSKSAGSTKLFGMQARGNLAAAQVVEVSKVVAGYLPKDLQQMITNVQDSIVGLYTIDSDTVYLYKYYSQGGEQVSMQAWFKWQLIGAIKHLTVINNYIVCIVKVGSEYRTLLLDLVQTLDPAEVDITPAINTARIDHSFVVKAGGTITYDSNTKKSTIPKPYTHVTGKTPIVLTAQTMADGTGVDYSTLYKLSPTPDATVTHDLILEVEVDGSGNWLIQGDWTGKEYDLVAGYEFPFEVELPRFFFRANNNVDWTASLTIARMKFDVGFSGAVDFYVTRYGAPEWIYLAGVIKAGYYLSNSTPTIDRTTLTVPIHQKNINFNLKIKSLTPFPVSLNSMTWEGNYAPRYYRRAG